MYIGLVVCLMVCWCSVVCWLLFCWSVLYLDVVYVFEFMFGVMGAHWYSAFDACLLVVEIWFAGLCWLPC